MKDKILAAFKHDQQTMNFKDLQQKYYAVRCITGIDAFSLVNRGKSQNRNDINVLGGNSNGGRNMAAYKSGHNV
ncbi:hypothetical protein NVP1101O_200 [Vibrio phage 1.101.O._10N.261.45.C6]|nr:hypothetical protein NVP1101O_200 [Vibrio phage 1.101.O._10N.261.45.C6]